MHIEYLKQLLITPRASHSINFLALKNYYQFKINSDSTEVSFEDFENFLKVHYPRYNQLLLHPTSKVIITASSCLTGWNHDLSLFYQYINPEPCYNTAEFSTTSFPSMPNKNKKRLLREPDGEEKETFCTSECAPVKPPVATEVKIEPFSKQKADRFVCNLTHYLRNRDHENFTKLWRQKTDGLWNYFCGKPVKFGNEDCKLEMPNVLNNFQAALISRRDDLIKAMWQASRSELIAHIDTYASLRKQHILETVLFSHSDIIDDYLNTINNPELIERCLPLFLSQSSTPRVYDKLKSIHQSIQKRIGNLREKLHQRELPSSISQPTVADSDRLVFANSLVNSPANEKNEQEEVLPSNLSLKENTLESVLSREASSNAENADKKRKSSLKTESIVEPVLKKPDLFVETVNTQEEKLVATTKKNKKQEKPRKESIKRTKTDKKPKEFLVEGPSIWIQYPELKTKLLEIQNQKQTNKKTTQTFQRCNYLLKLLENEKLFQYDEKDQSYSTWLTWTNQNDLLVYVKLIKHNVFKFYFKTVDAANGVHTLMDVNINVENNAVVIHTHKLANSWTQQDLDDIANDFHDLLPQASFTHTPFTPDRAHNRERMTENEFSETIVYYQNHNITTRLLKTLNGPYVFWLNWNNIDLKVTLENAPFSSYIFSENELMKQYYPNDSFSEPLRYYRIKVFESKQLKSQILELWSTLEALVLEVYKINAGKHIIGSVGIQIIKKFLDLLQPKNYYLQDLASITVQNPSAKRSSLTLPLRITKLLSEGQTWYEKQLNVQLVEASQWQSGWESKITLSQSRARFYEAVNALRNLSFGSLLDIWVEDHDWLIAIANKYYPNKPHLELMAKDIFTMIFSKRNTETADGYADLEKLYALLDLGNLIIEIDAQDAKQEPTHITNEIGEVNTIKQAKDIVQRCRVIGYSRFFGHLSEEKGAPDNISVSPVATSKTPKPPT